MQYIGEDRDTITISNRLLIQSGNFKKEITDVKISNITGVNSILEFDYMGSAEFECGALPRSLRRMTLNNDFYIIVEYDEYKDEKGNTLKGYVPKCSLEYAKKVVDRLVKSGNGLLEYCSLCDFVVKDGNSKDVNGYYKDNNFWWDIENDFFMFFEHADKILAAMENLKKNNFGYDKAEPKAVFNSLRLKLLNEIESRSNYNSILGNTLIRNYKYDEKNGIHFIEFANGSNLESVLMEAMLISKINLGQVLFGINGIDFNINAEDSLIQLVKQYSINSDSKVKDSKTLEEIETDVRFKNEKQRELCYVLRKVLDKKRNI